MKNEFINLGSLEPNDIQGKPLNQVMLMQVPLCIAEWMYSKVHDVVYS